MLDHVTTPIPDFTVEHWGAYEAERLSRMLPEQFRAFVLKCFGAVKDSGTGNSGTGVPPVKNHGQDAHATIHGYEGAIFVWVGEPDQRKAVAAADVQAFANAIRRTLRYKQDDMGAGGCRGPRLW